LAALSSGSVNIHQNIFLEHLMTNLVFDQLLKVITDPSVSSLAMDGLILLSLLCNYKKYEISNPYLDSLSKLSCRKSLKVWFWVFKSH
jgi:hypothetical protein